MAARGEAALQLVEYAFWVPKPLSDELKAVEFANTGI